MESHARAATDKARRYMIQLAKHWSHKFEVTYDDATARIPLPIGVCRMVAHADALEVTVDAADAEGLARMEMVVAEHLNRFAFREPLAFDWTRGAPN